MATRPQRSLDEAHDRTSTARKPKLSTRSPFACICLLAIANAATAAGMLPYTGVYQSWGRGCNGGAARLGPRTIEWRTTWSNCKASPYEVIDLASKDEAPHVALRVEKRSRNCRFEVIEIFEERNGMKMWGINGYPSLEAYRKRDLPGWADSIAEDRRPLACPLDPRPDPRR